MIALCWFWLVSPQWLPYVCSDTQPFSKTSIPKSGRCYPVLMLQIMWPLTYRYSICAQVCNHSNRDSSFSIDAHELLEAVAETIWYIIFSDSMWMITVFKYGQVNFVIILINKVSGVEVDIWNMLTYPLWRNIWLFSSEITPRDCSDCMESSWKGMPQQHQRDWQISVQNSGSSREDH